MGLGLYDLRLTEDERRYAGRVWRDQALRKPMALEIEQKLFALIPDTYRLLVKEGAYAIPGFPSALPHRWYASMAHPDEDSGWYATGMTLEGTLARLLGVILDGPIFPLT